MKMKILAVIALLVVASSFASAQSYGFESTGLGLFCNYEQLSVYGGAVWQGADNLTTNCGLNYNATIVGINAKLTAAGNPAGFSVKGVAYADNIYDAFSGSAGSYTGAQWLMLTAVPPCPIKHPYEKFQWIGFASMSGVVFGDNYGWLSCDIPGRNGVKATRGSSIGGVQVPVKR